MKLEDITLIVSATVTALMAGLFFSYSISVNLGLGKLTDTEYIKAMQSINREIQNPLFFICFFGALIMLPVATLQQHNNNKISFLFLLAATIFYALGVFGMTVFANVPLNNQLDKFNPATATLESISSMGSLFKNRWNFWNNIRTIASLLSIIFIICACLFRQDEIT
jgi:uncharacterized membrane protein